MAAALGLLIPLVYLSRAERGLAGLVLVLAALAGALLQGMVDYILVDFRVALLFWVLAGLGLGLCRAGVRPETYSP